MQKLNLMYEKSDAAIAPFQGKDARKIYEAVPEALRVNTEYDSRNKVVLGSTPFLVSGVDDVVRKYGCRTPRLVDLSLPGVMAFSNGKHYVDAKTLVARSERDLDFYDNNNSLLRKIFELAEEELRRIKKSFMIEGFRFVPDDSTSYGLTIVKGNEFRVIQDKRLAGKYNGSHFNEVDEFGIPIFTRNGVRTWYARDEGLSRLCLNNDLNVDSSSRSLNGSGSSGGVMVLGAEGTRGNFVKGLTDDEITCALHPETFGMRSQLEVAIMNQDFERAAELRDKIKSIDKEL